MGDFRDYQGADEEYGMAADECRRQWGTVPDHPGRWTNRVWWQTKDGRVMRYADMTDEHLGNALRHAFRRNGQDHPALVQEWRRRGFPEDGWRQPDGTPQK